LILRSTIIKIYLVLLISSELISEELIPHCTFDYDNSRENDVVEVDFKNFLKLMKFKPYT